MQFAWMRISSTTRPQLSISEHKDIVGRADRLGFDQLHLSGLTPEDIEGLPQTNTLRIGLDIAALSPQTPRALATNIRRIADHLNGRLVLRLTTSCQPESRLAEQTIETLLSQTTPNPLNSDLPMPLPHPDVLVVPQENSTPDLVKAASNGFHGLSPAWQTRSEISRHWPAIVAGATHAARRARPSHWHVARCIFVSDDPAEVDAYRNGPALSYLRQSAIPKANLTQLADEAIIAGSADEVAARLRQLRERIGPFETMHCVDPGLDPADIHCQQERLIAQVRPRLAKNIPAAKKELERI